MAVHNELRARAPRPSLFNDPVIRGAIYQVLVAATVIGFLAWIISNMRPARKYSTGHCCRAACGGW